MADPNEVITFRQTAIDGAELAIDMPRWAIEAIERGESVAVYRGGSGPDWRPIEDDQGSVVGRHYEQ